MKKSSYSHRPSLAYMRAYAYIYAAFGGWEAHTYIYIYTYICALTAGKMKKSSSSHHPAVHMHAYMQHFGIGKIEKSSSSHHPTLAHMR
jgi:hypothetical protein